jgi:lipopolysaccharide transport system permease protein
VNPNAHRRLEPQWAAYEDLFALLTKHRELTWEMTKRDVQDRYAGHALGIAWAVGHPLLMILVYVFVFSLVFRIRIGGTPEMPFDYTTYLLAGLVPWLACQDALTRGTGSILAHANLVKQVVFPIGILPVKAVLAAVPAQIIGTAVLAIYILVQYGTLPAHVALLPVLMVFQTIGLIGLCFALAPLGAYFRDLKDIVQILCSIAPFLMPVIYLPEQVPSAFQPLLYLNPFSYMAWCYQDIFFYGRFEHAWAWPVFMGGSVLLLALGYRTFAHVKNFIGNVL